jgi:hypothetical protein
MIAPIQFRIFCILTEAVKIKMYKSVILPPVLYGCVTKSLTLRVFENRVLSRLDQRGNNMRMEKIA